MALKAIEAKIECDGCGFIFRHDLDPAGQLKGCLDLSGYVDKEIDIVAEHMLCPDCLLKVADKLEDVEDPTWDQVHGVLAKAA